MSSDRDTRQPGARDDASAKGPAPDGPSAKADVPDAADKTIATVLGEIVWLMSQSPVHKQLPMADLEWLVMPAILLRQFRLFYHEGKPVAAVLYAFVSDEVERRIESGAPSMQPGDWKSGERAWIVQVIAPFGQAEAFAKETCNTALKGRDVKMQVQGRGKTDASE
jgi:cytolysin-activating lysine-acyltransferase